MSSAAQCPNCHHVHLVPDQGSSPGAGTVVMVSVIFVLTLVSVAMIFYMFRYFYALENAFG